MRLLAWNIRQGGGSRLGRIADALAHRDADILVLSEYRGGESAARLLATLDALGYRYVTKLVPPPSRNGVLIAARCPFREHGSVGSGLPEPYRIVSVEFPSFRLSGVYMPNLLAKIPYWEALIAAISPERDGYALAIGDFNTCRPFIDEGGAIDATAYYMDMIEEIGFCDLCVVVIPRAVNILGSASEATAFASTMPFYRGVWRHAPVPSAIRTRSASPGSRITLR